MVDVRAALRPLVENPAAEPRPVEDIAGRAARVRRQRARRRSALLAVSVVALLVLVNAGRFTDGSDNVTEVAPSREQDADTSTGESPGDGTSSTGSTDTTPGTAKEPAATTSTTPTTSATTAAAPTTGNPPPPPRPAGPHDPFGGLEAEHHDAQSGVAVTTMPGGGHAIRAGDGGFVAFHQVDFGGTLATRFEARVAPVAGADGEGTIEVRLHAADSPPFATLRVTSASEKASGDSGEPVTVSANTPAIGGKADVYVTFTSSQGGDLALVDWFRFRT